MALTVCTARLTYGGPGRLDITIAHKSAEWKAGRIASGGIFAPDGDAFRSVNDGRISQARYFEVYRAKLNLIRASNIEPILEGCLGERLVGVCYCVIDGEERARCHRTVWREWMVSRGAIDGGELPAEEQKAIPRIRLVKPERQRKLFE